MLKLDTIVKINRFFTKLYKVSFNVDIYYVDLKGRNGFQDDNTIYIQKSLCELDQELIAVHEINHVYQTMGYSITVPNIKAAIEEDLNLPHAIRRCEIDSRLVELLYSYSEFGEYGVALIKDKVYKGCTMFTANLSKGIFNLPEGKVKDLLVKDLEVAQLKANKLEDHYSDVI